MMLRAMGIKLSTWTYTPRQYIQNDIKMFTYNNKNKQMLLD